MFQIQYLTLDTWPGSPIVEWKIKTSSREWKETITISIAAWNYDTEIIIDLIKGQVDYQESSIGYEKPFLFSVHWK